MITRDTITVTIDINMKEYDDLMAEWFPTAI